MQNLAIALALLEGLAFKRNPAEWADVREKRDGKTGVQGVAHLNGLLPGGPTFLI